MKEIVVISGKGGTGKTSLVASFAALSESKVIADCDVDAADLHLICEPVVIEKRPFSGGKRAIVRANDCTACGVCKESCRFDAIVEDGGVYRVDEVFCEGCKVCVEVCPAQAVDFVNVENGVLFVSNSRFGPFVHAKLFAAEENSGKLVTEVKREAKKIAEEHNVALVLIDGAPGISCPVIASLSGASLAVIVTEPTPSGLYDFARAQELTKHFKLQTVCVINKSDLNPKVTQQIRERCSVEGIEIVSEIPYDDDVTRAQMAAKSVVEYSNGSASIEIKRCWEQIQRAIDF